MPRVAALVFVLGATACSGSSADGTTGSIPPQASPSAGDPVAALVESLEASGTSATLLDEFNPDPLADRGARLCVGGQEASVYVYPTPEDRAAAAARIDPTDPSNVGTAIIEWRGDPTFWGRDRLIVLYLGREPRTETTLSEILGPPFASGQGRDPGLDAHNC